MIDLARWYNILLNNSYEHQIFLIGNKSDLKEERKIAIEQGENFKNSYDDINKYKFIFII